MAWIFRCIFMEHAFFIACAKLRFVQWEMGLSYDSWLGKILGTFAVCDLKQNLRLVSNTV